jgi:hypothetical protein
MKISKLKGKSVGSHAASAAATKALLAGQSLYDRLLADMEAHRDFLKLTESPFKGVFEQAVATSRHLESLTASVAGGVASEALKALASLKADMPDFSGVLGRVDKALAPLVELPESTRALMNHASEFRSRIEPFLSERPMIPDLSHLRPQGFADAYHERIEERINAFVSDLDEGEECAVEVLLRGGGRLSATWFGYWNPDMIMVQGVDGTGRKVEALIHRADVQIVLTAIPAEGEKQERIGFQSRPAPEEPDEDEPEDASS